MERARSSVREGFEARQRQRVGPPRRVSPESMGLRPDGDAPAIDEPDDVVLPGTSFALAVRSGYFKIVSVGFVILMSAQVGALQHLFKLIA